MYLRCLEKVYFGWRSKKREKKKKMILESFSGGKAPIVKSALKALKAIDLKYAEQKDHSCEQLLSFSLSRCVHEQGTKLRLKGDPK